MTQSDRFVTIPYFVQEMLGHKNRAWYYRHVNDQGMPQRYKVGGLPRLSLAECSAYVEQVKGKPAAPPKRKRGRPRKVVTQPAA